MWEESSGGEEMKEGVREEEEGIARCIERRKEGRKEMKGEREGRKEDTVGNKIYLDKCALLGNIS